MTDWSGGLQNRRKLTLALNQVPITGTPEAILATVDHNVHRRRRNAYDKYFSKQSIRSNSNVLQAAVDKSCARMRQISKSVGSVNLFAIYSAMTADIASGYCFPEAYHLLDEPDCGTDLHWRFSIKTFRDPRFHL